MHFVCSSPDDILIADQSRDAGSEEDSRAHLTHATSAYERAREALSGFSPAQSEELAAKILVANSHLGSAAIKLEQNALIEASKHLENVDAHLRQVERKPKETQDDRRSYLSARARHKYYSARLFWAESKNNNVRDSLVKAENHAHAAYNELWYLFELSPNTGYEYGTAERFLSYWKLSTELHLEILEAISAPRWQAQLKDALKKLDVVLENSPARPDWYEYRASLRHALAESLEDGTSERVATLREYTADYLALLKLPLVRGLVNPSTHDVEVLTVKETLKRIALADEELGGMLTELDERIEAYEKSIDGFAAVKRFCERGSREHNGYEETIGNFQEWIKRVRGSK